MTISVVIFAFTACSSDDDFIKVDYTKDLAGIWTCLEKDYGCAMVINADGSATTTGLVGDNYWEDVKGRVTLKGNKISMTFENGHNFDGRFELVPGRVLSVIDTNTGQRHVYDYCSKDLSNEILGVWVSNQVVTDVQDNMMIQEYMQDGKFTWTGIAPKSGKFVVGSESTYKVVGDLIIIKRIKEEQVDGVSPYGVKRLTYTPDGTDLGDIMTYTLFIKKGDESVKVSASHLRLKQELNLPGQKYDYAKTFVSNVKGLDQDIKFMDFTFNFSKMDGYMLDNVMKAILFGIEFPDANTIRYSCYYKGQKMTMDCPIELAGNKMTLKMSSRNHYYRDVVLYAFQDKDDSQMHIYMPTPAFVNFFGNMQVTMMNQLGTIDLTDAAAVENIYKSIDENVESINVSFVMSKAK